MKTHKKASGIPVYCSHDAIVPLAELKPNPQNPNQHPAEQIELLAKIIKENGWRDRITVSNLSGLIVKGHGRYQAAALAGLDKAPVEYQDYASREDEIRDLIADNKISELSYLDRKMVGDLLLELENFEYPDLENVGFTEHEINAFIKTLGNQTGWNPPKTDEAAAGDGITELCGYSLSSFWKDIKNENFTALNHQIELPLYACGHELVKGKYSRTNADEIQRIVKTYMRNNDYFLENCCGWSTFGSIAKFFGFSGIGVDIWDLAIQHSKKQCQLMPGSGSVKIIKCDGKKLTFKDNNFDFIYCNPPFMDIEKYSGSDEDIADSDPNKFGLKFYHLMAENYRVLKNDGLCVITIADKRVNGAVLPLQSIVIDKGIEAGFLLHDFVVAEVVSQQLRLRKRSYNLRRTVKCHEYVIVFKK